jgi:ABC-type uncharacterized transport system ATPase subunit
VSNEASSSALALEALAANDRVGLELRAGEIQAYRARSGGKSTLMNVLNGLLKPDQGETLVGASMVRLIHCNLPGARVQRF